MSVYIVNLLQTLKKCLLSPKYNISASIEGNGIDIIYASELEIDTVLTYHCATYIVWPDPLLIVLYLVLTAKILGTPDLGSPKTRHCNKKGALSPVV